MRFTKPIISKGLDMRILLSVVLFGGVVGHAVAGNYDDRLYISPGASYIITDAGRGEDEDVGYSLTVGMPVSDTRNYELEVGFGDLGDTALYNLNANLLTFFDPNTPGLFTILSGGLLHSDGGPGDDYFSANVAGGIGAMIPAFYGSVRLEALLRADLHFNEDAGLGGKRAFAEPIFRLGYSIPLGAKSEATAPQGGDVAVVATSGDDSDSDGVNDDADLCPGTPLGTVVDATGCAVGNNAGNVTPADCRQPRLDEAVDEYGCAVDRSVILNDVNFEFDSDVLTADAESVLDDVAQVISTMPNATIEIAGHTSDEGDEYYNIDLSQRRAQAVRDYLIGAGVAQSQLAAKGYGDNAPLQPNTTVSGRRENRRVEVRVVQ